MTVLLLAMLTIVHGEQGSKGIEHHDVIHRIEANASRAISGMYQAKGIVKRNSSQGSESVSPLELRCAFDTTRNLLRYDYTENRRVFFNSDNGTIEKQASIGGKFAFGPDYSLHQSFQNPQTIVIAQPQQSVPSYVSMFDYRIAGIALPADVMSRRRYAEVLREVQLKPDGFSYENGKYKYVRRTTDKTHEIRVWFDSAQGFQPIRMEVQRLGLNERTGRVNDIIATSEASWVSVNDVYVPSFFRASSIPVISAGKLHYSEVREYSYTWQSLNQPIDKSQFEHTGFGIKDGQYTLIDKRPEQPLVLKLAGAKSEVEFVEVVMASGWSKHWPAIWKTGVFALCLFAVLFGIRVVWRRYTLAR